ncbi:MAG: helix-turn-helix domain-containing protein [Myxococcales bacterium]|jgi:XRE family aerobic/anaerobic benzoate catabolism transcriptional regulator|nr:helix-turn-helix domain-containing protein [Myxococcales bacterium]HQY61278.1 shikimate kinase [Polyangiaceae bacterium]
MPAKAPEERAASSRALAALGAEVRRLRHAEGATLAELAARTGLSARFLVSLEGGLGNISVVRLLALARALGVRAAELVDAAELASDRGPRVVSLVGLRGAGKTTVGAALARALRVPFVELDVRIAERAAMSLGMVFEMHGEAYFRRLEREVLTDFLAEGRPAVLATGGSLVTARDTYATLRRETHTVWLRARAEDHFRRVVAQGDGRPMKGRDDAMNELRALLRERAPLYGAAELTVDTAERDASAVTALLVERFAGLRAASAARPRSGR